MGGFFSNMTSNLGKKALINLAIPLAENVVSKLATKETSAILDKFKRKITGKRTVRAGKWFTLFVSSKDMDDIIKIIESLENSVY